jgi:hypothetical protein
VVVFAGMTKVAWAVVALGREIEVPVMVPPIVMLLGTTFDGGFGGVVGRVIVMVTVAPRTALPPGATDVDVPPPPVVV